MKMKHKLIAFLLISTLLSLSLVGCSSKSSSDPGASMAANSTNAPAETKAGTSDKKTTLTFWNGLTGPDRPAVDALVEKFNKDNPNIEVKIESMPFDKMYQKMNVAFASGEGPEIVILGPESIGTYASSGGLLPIDDFYTDVNVSVLPNGYDDAMKYQGKHYGYPFSYFTMALYYNKDLFKAAGLDPEKPPTNWQELADDAVKLTKEGSGSTSQYGFVFPSAWTNWPILMWGNGGDVMDYQTKKATINSDKSVEAVKYWSDLILNKHIAPAKVDDAAKLFSSKKAAMTIDGPWATSGYKDAGINYGIVPIPAGPAQQATFGAGNMLFMTKFGESKKEQIKAFFQHMWSKESQTFWATTTGFPPSRNDLPEADLAVNPDIKVFSEGAKFGRFFLVGLQSNQKISTDVVTPAIDEILLKKADVKQSLDKAAKKIDEILAAEK
jgi:multiple sugar transport system substrate-binding protein